MTVIETAEQFVALRLSEIPEEYRRAAQDSAPDRVWLDVIDRFPEMQKWVAQNKATPVAILSRLARDPDAAVRWWVANANRADVELLRSLAGDPDEAVRHRVSRHKRAPLDVLESLRRDDSTVVRDVAEARLRERG